MKKNLCYYNSIAKIPLFDVEMICDILNITEEEFKRVILEIEILENEYDICNGELLFREPVMLKMNDFINL